MQVVRGGRSRVALAAMAVAVTAVVGACSGNSDSSSEGGTAEAQVATADRAVVGMEGVAGDAAEEAGGDPAGHRVAAADGAAGREVASSAVNRPTVSTRAVIRRGEIAVVTKEMNRARVEIEDLLAEHGGYIASEDTGNDRHGQPERSTLVLRVPEPAFDDVMSALAEVGRTRHAERSSEDVTEQVVDVDARVATAEAGLARLRELLRQTSSVEDMIRVEAELAKRQADLESLKAQQKYLHDHTAMSTVTVRLRTPGTPPPAPEPDEAGFLVGLSGGWTALKAVLVGAATVVGALLPFVVVLALLGAPVWLVLRRRHTAPPAAAPDAG